LSARLGDSKSTAYALAGDIFISTILGTKSTAEFDAVKNEALAAATASSDAYIQNWIRYVITQEEFHRGRMNKARDGAHELMQLGKETGDPRSIGLGLGLLSQIALTSASYAEGLGYAEQSLSVAITPIDRSIATSSKACALVLLGGVKEGEAILGEYFLVLLKNLPVLIRP